MSHFVGRRSLPVASGPIAGPYEPLEADDA
jgi:hypothetical protein